MRRLTLTTLPAAGLALALLLPVAAQAQMISSREGIALENQILELKHQLQMMQQNGGNGGNGGSVLGAPASSRQQGQSGGPNALVSNLLQQVQTLGDQVQSLRGRVDTLEHEVATQHDEINQEIGNLKFKLGQGGQGTLPNAPGSSGRGAAAPTSRSGTSPQKPPASQAAPAHSSHASPSPRAEASLRAARDALGHHDYAKAEADARAVIAKRGKGADHGAAELVLAESLSRQGRHQEAAIAYDDTYNVSHSGPNAPDALLGLANSLSAIHQNQEACDTLDSLTSQFSSPSSSLEARIRDARRRAHCL